MKASLFSERLGKPSISMFSSMTLMTRPYVRSSSVTCCSEVESCRKAASIPRQRTHDPTPQSPNRAQQFRREQAQKQREREERAAEKQREKEAKQQRKVERERATEGTRKAP